MTAAGIEGVAPHCAAKRQSDAIGGGRAWPAFVSGRRSVAALPASEALTAQARCLEAEGKDLEEAAWSSPALVFRGGRWSLDGRETAAPWRRQPGHPARQSHQQSHQPVRWPSALHGHEPLSLSGHSSFLLPPAAVCAVCLLCLPGSSRPQRLHADTTAPGGLSSFFLFHFY